MDPFSDTATQVAPGAELSSFMVDVLFAAFMAGWYEGDRVVDGEADPRGAFEVWLRGE